MIKKGSRYEKARGFVYSGEVSSPFRGTRPREIGRATGVVEHRVRSWERIEQLAEHYYNDARKWWRIIDANPDILFAGELLGETHAGRVILIPRAEEAKD